MYHDDGVKINLHQDASQHKLARHSVSEYWVLGGDEGVYGGFGRTNNSESIEPEKILHIADL